MKKREVKNWLCSSGLLLVRLSKSSIFCAAAHFRYVLGSVGVIVLLQIGSWFPLMPLLWLRQWLRISIKTSPHQRSWHVFLQLFHVHIEICVSCDVNKGWSLKSLFIASTAFICWCSLGFMCFCCHQKRLLGNRESCFVSLRFLSIFRQILRLLRGVRFWCVEWKMSWENRNWRLK